MSVSAKLRRRGRIAVWLTPLAALVVAASIAGPAAAVRPLPPSESGEQPCVSILPRLHVNGPGKRVTAPGRARVIAQIGSDSVSGCFPGPLRVCLRVEGRAGDDLTILRRCFRRGDQGSRLSRKIAFMVRVGPGARGTYSLLARSRVVSPDDRLLRYSFERRARTKLRVRAR